MAMVRMINSSDPVPGGRIQLILCSQMPRISLLPGAQKPAQAHLSEQATFGERKALPVAHDDVIQQAYVHQRKRLLNALGNEFVSL